MWQGLFFPEGGGAAKRPVREIAKTSPKQSREWATLFCFFFFSAPLYSARPLPGRPFDSVGGWGGAGGSFKGGPGPPPRRREGPTGTGKRTPAHAMGAMNCFNSPGAAGGAACPRPRPLVRGDGADPGSPPFFGAVGPLVAVWRSGSLGVGAPLSKGGAALKRRARRPRGNGRPMKGASGRKRALSPAKKMGRDPH